MAMMVANGAGYWRVTPRFPGTKRNNHSRADQLLDAQLGASDTKICVVSFQHLHVGTCLRLAFAIGVLM